LINSYRIVFRIFGNEVLVVRIIHQARGFMRDMPFGLDELMRRPAPCPAGLLF
jgi:hypothetical protein